MASSFVVIFLLDYLPGNVLNITSLSECPLEHITNFQQCSRSHITDPIVNVVGKKLNIKVVPKWKSDHEKLINLYYLNKSKDILKESSAETLYNLQAVLDNTIENSNSLEKVPSFIKVKYENDLLSDDRSECEIENIKNIETYNNTSTNLTLIDNENELKGLKESFPDKVPFLVAIFETLANVTAQTCGGTLVSPHWVLTAANCVNVLGSVYNTTNSTEKSRYTIVANATNPLVDGSVHNVTQVVLHPESSQPTDTIIGLIKHLHNTFVQSKQEFVKGVKDRSPMFALMRVSPAVGGGAARVVAGAGEGEAGDVRVYGWVLAKNESNSTMHASSFPAKTMSGYDCEVNYGVTDSKSTLCLAASNDTARNATQLSSGGPVLSMSRGQVQVLAVAQTDEHTPLLASPLAPHAAWIHRLIHTQ